MGSLDQGTLGKSPIGHRIFYDVSKNALAHRPAEAVHRRTLRKHLNSRSRLELGSGVRRLRHSLAGLGLGQASGGGVRACRR
jgi:hypothetical protein